MTEDGKMIRSEEFTRNIHKNRRIDLESKKGINLANMLHKMRPISKVGVVFPVNEMTKTQKKRDPQKCVIFNNGTP